LSYASNTRPDKTKWDIEAETFLSHQTKVDIMRVAP
jgi:hypothetical protein